MPSSRRGPLGTPLIQAWELRQTWLMYAAAYNVLEDALCDLVSELRSEHSIDELIIAVGARDVSQLEVRVSVAREQRGRSGDPRRIPVQRRIAYERGTAVS